MNEMIEVPGADGARVSKRRGDLTRADLEAIGEDLRKKVEEAAASPGAVGTVHDELIVPVDHIPEPPPPQWQQLEDGSWEIDGLCKVVLLDQAWRVQHGLDVSGPLDDRPINVWSSPQGSFPPPRLQ